MVACTRIKVLIVSTLVVFGAGLSEIGASAHASLGDLDAVCPPGQVVVCED